jgi:DNA gyrase subunit A
VIGTLAVHDGDEILMVTTSGKIQRIRAGDISVIGRNTQGVRIMKLDDEDLVVSIARIPEQVAGGDEPVAE